MTGIYFLKKAALADSLGKFRLADNYFIKAVRLAGGAGTIAEDVMKALEKLGLVEAEKIALEAGTKSVEEILLSRGAAALEKFIKDADSTLLKEYHKLAGTEERLIESQIQSLKALPAEGQMAAIQRLKATIMTKEGSVFKLRPDPVPLVPPGPTSVGRKLLDRMKEIDMSKLSPLLQKIFLNPNKLKAFSAWLSTGVVTYQIVGGVIKFFDPKNGLELPLDKVISMFTAATPSNETGEGPAGSGGGSGEAGSGAGGAAGTPDPTTAPGFQYKTKEDMYDRRMKAKMPGGKFQQTSQGDKAQKFVEDNKANYKTQRQFYNAALAAGDKNFANSVIALVKKDLDLNVDTNDPRKF
jgi:hypothetical protein